jgi:ribosomal protein L6P/L9E
MERVLLMNNQEGVDLIVSFAIEDIDSEETKSLILLRTPKYESVFEDHERGVSVSYNEQSDSEADEDLLIRVSIVQNMVTVVSKYHRYELDVSSVDPEKLAEACRILRQMNFDSRFILEIPHL